MAFPALLPFLAAAGRVLAGAGSRAVGATVGKQGMAALAAVRNTGNAASIFNRQAAKQAAQSTVAESVTKQGMANLIGRSASFGDLLSGKRTTKQEVDEKQNAANEQAAAEGVEKRKEAEEALVRSAVVLTGAMTGLTVAALKTPSVMEKWARGILAGQEGLRRFNGEINNAFAKLEFGDLVRTRNTANATSGTTRILAESINEMSDDLQDLKHMGITLLNLFGTAAAKTGGILAWMIKQDVTWGTLINTTKLIEQNTKKENNATFENFLHDIGSGKFSGMTRDRVPPPPKPEPPKKK